MSVFEELCAKNPQLKIYSVEDACFATYGELLDPSPYAEVFSALSSTPVPTCGNTYVAAAQELELKSALIAVSQEYYAGEHAQIGYCNGHSHKINCMEYHDDVEIDLAGSDMVLFLGRVEDMDGLRLDTAKLKCFFVPAGAALCLKTGTLHFAPCRIYRSGFRCGVILRRGTNSAVPPESRHGAYFAQGKWLIGHTQSRQVREMHALEGLFGKNEEIFPID